jgi:hypothetical protein
MILDTETFIQHVHSSWPRRRWEDLGGAPDRLTSPGVRTDKSCQGPNRAFCGHFKYHDYDRTRQLEAKDHPGLASGRKLSRDAWLNTGGFGEENTFYRVAINTTSGWAPGTADHTICQRLRGCACHCPYHFFLMLLLMFLTMYLFPRFHVPSPLTIVCSLTSSGTSSARSNCRRHQSNPTRLLHQMSLCRGPGPL